jgi:hypothetical protein
VSRDDLRTMLADLAEDINQTRPTVPDVVQAIRARRRRRVVVGAAVMVAVTSSAGVAVWRPLAAPSVPVASPSADTTNGATLRIDRPGLPAAVDPAMGPYWPGALPPPTVPRLAVAPLSHAVLLFRPDSPETAPVYAYGEGTVRGGSGDGRFRWTRLDIGLSSIMDAAGNRFSPLGPNSLGPKGVVAAFPQPDSVVVVRIRTGEVARIAVPGRNESLTWLPDGVHLLVSSRERTYLVNVETRRWEPAIAPAGAVAPLVGSGSGVLTLAPSGDQPLLRRYDDGGLAQRDERTVDLTPYRGSELVGRGWRHGGRLAQTLRVLDSASGRAVVAVVDEQSARVTHVLDLAGTDAECCTVAGWANRTDVLVLTSAGLLTWHLATGTVTRLTEPLAGGVSVAPTGCGWSVAVGGVTSSCAETTTERRAGPTPDSSYGP